MFKGLSTLRKQEKKSAVVTEEAKKLQAYLSKYSSAAGRNLTMQSQPSAMDNFSPAGACEVHCSINREQATSKPVPYLRLSEL